MTAETETKRRGGPRASGVRSAVSRQGPRSSVGQNTGLLIRKCQVQALAGAPPTQTVPEQRPPLGWHFPVLDMFLPAQGRSLYPKAATAR